MKSRLGLTLAFFAAAGFGLAFWMSVRPGARWLDGQWLFLAALPYDWTQLHLLGAADFSPDSAVQIGAALAFDVALAFAAGALVEAIVRMLWRLISRSRARA